VRKLLSFIAIALLCLGLSATVSEKTATYSIGPDDDGDTIVMNSASATTVNLPGLGTGNIGFIVTIVKHGAGNVTIQTPLADYIGDATVANGTLVNSVAAETYASVTLQLTKLHYWRIVGAEGTWTSAVSTRSYGYNRAVPGAIGGTTPAAGAFTTLSGTAITGTTVSTGSLGAAAATGNVATENAVGTVHSTVLTLTNVDIAPAAAAGGVAFGNVKLYDFPAGHVYFLGAVADLALTDTIAAGAEMAGNFATWTVPVAPGTWDYDTTTASEWHHDTGDDTALTTDVVPVAGTTYTVSVTMATTTAGGGLVIAMGGVAQSEVHDTGTETWTFTASDTTALTLTPASGTWVGDVSAVSVTTDTPVSATWDGDIAFGTTADADGSLAGTEVDLVASTATPQAVTGATTGDCQSTATEQTILDGHSTAKDLILNLLIDAADFVDAGTGALHLNGTVTITWINLGDN